MPSGGCDRESCTAVRRFIDARGDNPLLSVKGAGVHSIRDDILTIEIVPTAIQDRCVTIRFLMCAIPKRKPRLQVCPLRIVIDHSTVSDARA